MRKGCKKQESRFFFWRARGKIRRIPRIQDAQMTHKSCREPSRQALLCFALPFLSFSPTHKHLKRNRLFFSTELLRHPTTSTLHNTKSNSPTFSLHAATASQFAEPHASLPLFPPPFKTHTCTCLYSALRIANPLSLSGKTPVNSLCMVSSTRI